MCSIGSLSKGSSGLQEVLAAYYDKFVERMMCYKVISCGLQISFLSISTLQSQTLFS